MHKEFRGVRGSLEGGLPGRFLLKFCMFMHFLGSFSESSVLSYDFLEECTQLTSARGPWDRNLAHQNRTIAIASDFRVDGAKSPEIPQKEGVLGSEIAARNRKSLAATFHRTLKSQCSIASSCLRNRAISGVRDGHRNRKSQKSLRFRRAKDRNIRPCLLSLCLGQALCMDLRPCWAAREGNVQKPGDHSNFRKNALGVKRTSSRSSRRVPGTESDSRNGKIYSRNGISRPEQYETRNSRSGSPSDSRN